MGLKGKKIVVMGLGLHGGGRAVAEWVFRHGARVIVTDTKTDKELSSSLNALLASCTQYRARHPGDDLFDITFHLGGHREADFESCDMVIQNPGVPRESPFLTRAREHGIPVENEATLLFALTGKTPKIVVTGTRGKSTTTALIGDMLSRWNPLTRVVGIATHEGAQSLVGIIDPLCAQEENGVIAPAVLELSSWQLELFSGRKFRPAVAVVTNVMRDHLNRYRGMDDYSAAKHRIFENQHEHDARVLNYDNGVTVRWGLEDLPSRRYWFTRKLGSIDRGAYIGRIAGVPFVCFKDKGESEEILPVSEIRLRGEHNLENALAAVTAAKIWGVPTGTIRESLQAFEGLSGRCEEISRVGGRRWINDTTATTPDACAAALKALSSEGNVILIAGGADKNLDYSSLAPLIKERVRALVLLSGTATPRLVEALKAEGFGGSLLLAQSMQDAVDRAWSESSKGDSILLSPAAASFGMFANELDQGRQFIQAVKTYEER